MSDDGSMFGVGDRRAAERRHRERRRGPPGEALARLRRHWPWAVAGLVLAIAVAIALFRQPLAEALWPETRAETLRAQAAVALSQGRLSAADGTGARELYEAVLAIDPDRDDARQGLARVADAALSRASAAVDAGRFADAHRDLQLARALSVPQARADIVAARLRAREAAHAGIEDLLRAAAAARRGGRVDGSADAALPLYQRVLELQPQRTEALEGREDVLAGLLQDAGAALDRGELTVPVTALATARRYDAGHADLPELQARLARVVEDVRKRADDDLRRGRLEPAVQGYRKLLDVDPADVAAAQGLERAGLAHAARAERAAADFRFGEAEAALQRAQALAPGSAAVADAARHLQRARQSQSRLQPPAAGRRGTRVAALLAEAAAAEARGDLLDPPGDSAFDKLRAARALAPTSPAVRAASARLLPAAKACFESELRGNNLARARACLDARGVLEGEPAALVASRRRLAQRWLAVGDERLGAGEVARAASALAAARDLDPAAPGLDAFAQRVRAASAGRP